MIYIYYSNTYYGYYHILLYAACLSLLYDQIIYHYVLISFHIFLNTLIKHYKVSYNFTKV